MGVSLFSFIHSTNIYWALRCTRYCEDTREELSLHSILLWVSGRMQNDRIPCLQPCDDDSFFGEQSQSPYNGLEGSIWHGPPSLSHPLYPSNSTSNFSVSHLLRPQQSLASLPILPHAKHASAFGPLHSVSLHLKSVPWFPHNSPSFLPSRFCSSYTFSMRPTPSTLFKITTHLSPSFPIPLTLL